MHSVVVSNEPVIDAYYVTCATRHWSFLLLVYLEAEQIEFSIGLLIEAGNLITISQV
jgi:hypothetical protein